MVTTLLNAFGSRRTAPREILLAPQNYTHVEVRNSDDLNSALRDLQTDASFGLTVPTVFLMSAKRYQLGLKGQAYTIPGVVFRGVPGTQIAINGVEPAQITKPSHVGYPTTKTVTTQCLGMMLRADRTSFANEIAFEGIHFVGHLGAVTTAGHYTGLSIEGNNVRFTNCTFTNEDSDTYDSATSVTFSAADGTGVPADNTDVVIDPGAAAAHTFRFKAGGGSDSGVLHHINTTTANTGALCATALISSINTNLGALLISAGAISSTSVRVEGICAVNEAADSGNDIVVAPVKSPYKALSRRGFTSFTTVHVGQDFWDEADPDDARPVSCAIFEGCHFDGEPLNETSQATGVLTHVRTRKAHSIIWERNVFGRFADPRHQVMSDVILSSVPVANDKITIKDFDPWTRETTNIDYVFVAALTSDTATAKQVLIAAGDVALNATRLADKINNQRVDMGGARFSSASYAYEYLGGTPTNPESSIRIKQLRVGESLTLPPGGIDHRTYTPSKDNPYVTATVAAPAPITVRSIGTGTVRSFTQRNGLVIMDSIPSMLSSTSIAPDTYNDSCLQLIATNGGSFDKNVGSEAGHTVISNWVGHGVGLLVGDSLIRCRGGAYVDVASTCQFGVVGGLTTSSVVGRFEPGVNFVHSVNISAANVADTNTVTLADGSGNTKIFEFDDNDTITGGNVAVAVGADALSSLRNLQNAIEAQNDAHAIHATTLGIIDGGAGSFTLFVYFWTETLSFATTPTSAKSGANITVANTSHPWSPSVVKWDAAVHYAAVFGTDTSMPILWCDKVVELVSAHCRVEHVRPLDYSFASGSFNWGQSAQAVFNIYLAALPADGKTFILNSIDAGAPGTAVTFEFDTNASVVESAVLRRIDISDTPTLSVLADRIVTAINATAAANSRAFFATKLTPLFDGVALVPPFAFEGVRVVDGQPGVNATLVTRGAGGADPGVANLFVGPIDDIGFGAGIGVSGTQGKVVATNMDDQGTHLPFVYIDCTETVTRVEATPLSLGGYAAGMASWQNLAYSGQANEGQVLRGKAFGGGPMQLVYYKKTNANIPSKHRLVADVGVPFGAGRVQGATATSPYYDLGGNGLIVAADVKVSGSQLDGVMAA